MFFLVAIDKHAVRMKMDESFERNIELSSFLPKGNNCKVTELNAQC